MKRSIISLFLFLMSCQQRPNVMPSKPFVNWTVRQHANPFDSTYVGYSFRWGNASFTRAYSEEIITEHGNPYKLIGENATSILIEASEGRYEVHAIVLPLTDTGKVLRFEDPHAYDLNHNLIAYFDDLGHGNDSVIVVENFLTAERRRYSADGYHRDTSKVNDPSDIKMEFRGSDFNYQWSAKNSNPDDLGGDWMSRTVPLVFSK